MSAEQTAIICTDSGCDTVGKKQTPLEAKIGATPPAQAQGLGDSDIWQRCEAAGYTQCELNAVLQFFLNYKNAVKHENNTFLAGGYAETAHNFMYEIVRDEHGERYERIYKDGKRVNNLLIIVKRELGDTDDYKTYGESMELMRGMIARRNDESVHESR